MTKISGIVAIPRDKNPYQELLYSQLRLRGYRIKYAPELTRSRTINLLLLPFQLTWLSLRGYTVLHVHWTYSLGFPFGNRVPGVRRVSRLWFGVVLWAASLAKLHIVWTAHNVLPHAQVFDDDRRARRMLIEKAELVIAHSTSTIEELRTTLASPRRSVVIPHGVIDPDGLLSLDPPSGDQPRSVLYFGRIEPYKGVEDLLAALAGLDGELRVHVAGSCSDPILRDRLERASADLRGVTLALGYVPDRQIRSLFAQADAVVFPYRAITTSGSLTLAQAAGRVAIVPALPAFAELPDDAVVRYAPGVDGLRSALRWLTTATTEELKAKGRASRSVSASLTWSDIADLTCAALDALSKSPNARAA